MKMSTPFGTRWMLTIALAGTTMTYAGAQQPAGAPVPITSDTPAATTKPMPPETTPVQGSAPGAAPLTKDEMKAQRKQQKAEEKASGSNAKAAKSNAKAKKQTDKALQDQEKASSTAAVASKPQ